MLAMQDRPLQLGYMPVQFCSYQALASSPASGGRATAVLSPAPADLSQSAGVEYPPCAGDPTARLRALSDVVAFQIDSETRYVGAAGTLYLTVDTPSAAAVARGLYLGNPAGSLPDGTPLYLNATATEPSSYPSTLIQWAHGDSVVTLASNDLSASALESLASSVTVS